MKLLGSRFFVACVASTVTALVVGGIAWAVQSPVDGAGVVHACYNATTGAVKLDVVGSCPTTGDKTPITWSAQGAPGPQGAPGAIGPQGAKGDPAPVNGTLLPLDYAHAVQQGSKIVTPPVDTSACADLALYWQGGSGVGNVYFDSAVGPNIADIVGSQIGIVAQYGGQAYPQQEASPTGNGAGYLIAQWRPGPFTAITFPTPGQPAGPVWLYCIPRL